MTHDWYPRAVLFVSDVRASLGFYTNKLEFSEDWAHTEDSEVIVAQVSRNGFEIILNKDSARAGKGRVFISLYDEHITPLRKVIKANGLSTSDISWGMPVTVIMDLDQNEASFISAQSSLHILAAPESIQTIACRCRCLANF